ncbi:MAG: GNAT family N-acetyltransferase [Tissierellaceae bacterium]|jgi:predicted GNAT family N-acyltransferase|nr:GNAT family N-acetyltransferase [Tissierellia bacterium]
MSIVDRIEMRSIDYGSDEYEVSIDIRNEAFRKPWGMDIRDEDLTGDKDMDLYGAYLDGTMIATVFLTEDDKDTARVKSVAILKEYRKQGLGTYLMDFIENIARERGYTKVNLMGRVSVEEFYHKLGYKTISEPYDYHTIPHVDMTKNL